MSAVNSSIVHFSMLRTSAPTQDLAGAFLCGGKAVGDSSVLCCPLGPLSAVEAVSWP